HGVQRADVDRLVRRQEGGRNAHRPEPGSADVRGTGGAHPPTRAGRDRGRLRLVAPPPGGAAWRGVSSVPAVRFLVRGRVQGVRYRWFVRREAERLALRGTVRDLCAG